VGVCKDKPRKKNSKGHKENIKRAEKDCKKRSSKELVAQN
tara:strand:- start:2857 stop:2976 length:120 start_codon:yes stop_codon:yes gene_type:complete